MARQLCRLVTLTVVATCAAVVSAAGQASTAANEALWEAARLGDAARITAALETGADINARSRYDVTPLILAANNGRMDAVKLLVARGADVNAQDSFYHARAAELALTNGHADVATFLLQSGANADGALAAAVQMNAEGTVKAALAGKVTREGLQGALSLAGAMKRDALSSLIQAAFDKLPAATTAAFSVDAAKLPAYAGTYRDAGSGMTLAVTAQGDQLLLQVQGQPQVKLVPSAEDVFRVVEVNATLTFQGRGGSMALIRSRGRVESVESVVVCQRS